MNKDELRAQHLLDTIRCIDWYVTKGEWEHALYHVQTAENLITACAVQDELNAMRAEREREEKIIELRC